LALKDDNDDNFSENMNKSFRPITNKQKHLVGEIKNNVDVFIKEFNNYFFENFFQKIFDRIQAVLAEKNNKKETVNISYNQQIKEMESLLEQGKKLNLVMCFTVMLFQKIKIFLKILDSEDNYKESIKAILNSLLDEKKSENQKIDDEYKIKINELKEELMKFNVRGESDVQIIEEKFKLDVYNSVGNMFNFK